MITVPIVGENTYEDLSIIDPVQREIHFGQLDHVRIYGTDFVSRLESNGFEVSTYNTSDLAVIEEARYFGLPTDEPIFFCHKKRILDSVMG